MKVRRTLATWFILVLALLVCPGNSLARRAKTISFVPDPSCRSNKLVTVVEEILADHLKVEDLTILDKDKGRANVLMQYFLIQRKEGDQVSVQIDGRVFQNLSGKLLTEASAESDPFDDDEAGRVAAGKQAAQKLAESLTTSLEEALWAKGKGRRVMLQVTLGEAAAPFRSAIMERLEKTLRGSSPQFKGSTDRNLILVFHSSERTKDLVDLLKKALEGKDGLKATWQMQSDNTLMVSLKGGS
jgi:hypothetical protein